MLGMSEMLRISVETVRHQVLYKCLTFSETQAQAGLNDDGNFRNGGDFGNVRNVGNVKNFRNVMIDIKCHTFSEPQP